MLIDAMTSYSCFVQTGKFGVSVSLNLDQTSASQPRNIRWRTCNHVQQLKQPQILKIQADQISYHQNLACQKCHIFDEMGNLLATGSHIKFL